MLFINNKIKIQKRKNSLGIKAFIFLSIAFIAFICLINSVYTSPKIKNILRQLAEDQNKKRMNEICMAIKGYDLYDIKELEATPYNITKDISLRFCKNIEGEKSSCIYKNGNNKIKLAGDIKGENGNYNKFDVQNDGTIKIELATGDKNKKLNKNYKVEINLKCDKNKKDFTKSKTVKFDIINEYYLKIEGACMQACVIKERYGKDIGLVARIIIGVVLLGIGIFLGFLGYKGRKITIFFVCIVGLVFIAYAILNLCNEKTLVIQIIVLSVFGLAGVGLSIFFVCKKEYLKFYMIIVSGITGYVIGAMVNDLGISLINTEHIKLIKIMVLIFCVAFGVFLGICLTKGTFIVGTSIIGSYCIMRALSLFLNNVVPFVNELKIYDLATHGNYGQITQMIVGLFLIYPCLLVVLIIITILIQFKFNPNWKDDDYNDLGHIEPLNMPLFKKNDY